MYGKSPECRPTRFVGQYSLLEAANRCVVPIIGFYPAMDWWDGVLSVGRPSNDHGRGHVVKTLRNGSPSAHNGSYGSPNVTYGDYGQPLTKSVVVSFVRAPNGPT